MWRESKRVRTQAGNIHVYFRGNSRFNVFFDDKERIEFLKHCRRASVQHDTIIEQFVLMDNHAHLQVKTSNVTKFASSIQQGYVQWYNWKNGTSDRLFKSPFGSASKISEEWVLDSMLYILQNPIKARICSHPSEYKWSSYHFHFNKHNLLKKYIDIDSTFCEKYFKNKDSFSRAILEKAVALPQINEYKAGDFESITDVDLAKYIFEITEGKSIFSLSLSEQRALILRLFQETNANLRQISSLTHESYDHVRKICGTSKKLLAYH